MLSLGQGPLFTRLMTTQNPNSSLFLRNCMWIVGRPGNKVIDLFRYLLIHSSVCFLVWYIFSSTLCHHIMLHGFLVFLQSWHEEFHLCNNLVLMDGKWQSDQRAQYNGSQYDHTTPWEVCVVVYCLKEYFSSIDNSIGSTVSWDRAIGPLKLHSRLDLPRGLLYTLGGFTTPTRDCSPNISTT